MLERVRSIRRPLLTLLGMLLGISAIAVARHRLSAESAVLSALDLAISDALAGADVSTAAGDARLRALVAERRDVQIRAKRLSNPWPFVHGGGVGLVISSVLSGVISGGLIVMQRLSRAKAHPG